MEGLALSYCSCARITHTVHRDCSHSHLNQFSNSCLHRKIDTSFMPTKMWSDPLNCPTAKADRRDKHFKLEDEGSSSGTLGSAKPLPSRVSRVLVSHTHRTVSTGGCVKQLKSLSDTSRLSPCLSVLARGGNTSESFANAFSFCQPCLF